MERVGVFKNILKVIVPAFGDVWGEKQEEIEMSS